MQIVDFHVKKHEVELVGFGVAFVICEETRVSDNQELNVEPKRLLDLVKI